MATYGRTVRRGLPRRTGGDPWPPADTATPLPGDEATTDAAATTVLAESVEAVVVESGAGETVVEVVTAEVVADAPAEAAAAAPGEAGAAETVASATAPVGGVRAIRRGLPRVAGGEPWPPASAVASAAAAATSVAAEATPAAAPVSAPAQAAPAAASTAAVTTVAQAGAGTGASLRRGLPRVAGGEPWPPAGFAPDPASVAPSAAAVAAAPTPAATEPAVAAAASAPAAPAVVATSAPAAAAASTSAPAPAVPAGPLTPLPFTRTAWPGVAARTRPAAPVEPQRFGPFTRGQWVGAVIVGGAGLLFAAAMAVFLVRWFISLEVMQDFLTTYPGEYHLPEGAPVGFPAWLGWQHFFNVFLMVLIIRSGLQVRSEKRPGAFWSPRTNPKRKISLNLWFHQSLDILWLVNGVVFVVLLFVTGQWMRIVPTSWEVFPNALSAALQYVSLDWPTENGWVNYNSLQQLAYFATVFLAAPLAAITGVRMSGIWPQNAKKLSAAYPVEWARAVHFPVMLYFVLFIIVHVTLVFATGALRNLNHMYAAQGSVDPDAYLMNWTGFWIFAASLLVIAAGWVAARPLILAPIARLFGKVSAR